MDPLHAIALTVGLFVLALFNPGANLFIVVQTSLTSGRRAGMLTGLGVALGDMFYSGLGLFGLATLITQCEGVFSVIKIAGGIYLLWFAVKSMTRQPSPQSSALLQPLAAPWYVFFRNGILTCLSNPQTVIFFISIFSITLSVTTPAWAKLLAWCGIVLSSVIWRLFLSQAFSLPAVRRGYARTQRIACRAIGTVIGMFAIKLIYEGVMRK